MTAGAGVAGRRTSEGRVIGRFRPSDGPLRACAWSPDGQRLAVGGNDNAVYLLDRQGTLLWRGKGHERSIWCLAFSPASGTGDEGAARALLASGSTDNSIRLWDPETGAELGCLRGHSEWVLSLAFMTPVGTGRSLLISGSKDKTVRLWDPNSGQELRRLNRHGDWVRCVAVLGAGQPGQRIASGSSDGTIRLWDPETGAELARLSGHQGVVSSLAYAPDTGAGSRLASSSGDDSIRVWDPDSGRELQCLTGHADWVRSVAFAPDGRTLASGSQDHSVRLWDSHTGAELACLTGHGTDDQYGVWCVAFAPDGTLASVAHDGNLILWDVADLLHPFPRPAAGRAAGGDTLGRWLARQAATVGRGPGGEDPDGPGAPPRAPDLWVPGGLPNDGVEGCLGVLRPAEPGPSASRVALSPDGRRLYAGHEDGSIPAYDLETNMVLWETQGHRDQIQDLALDRNGRMLASASDDRTVGVWDPETGRELSRLSGHTHSVFSVAFTAGPDAALLASGASDATVRLWDPRTGRQQLCLTGRHSYIYVNSVAFAPGPRSSILASGSHDGKIRLCDPLTGLERLCLAGHEGPVYSVAFAPAALGPLLASGSGDKTIRLWDPETGREVRRLEGHENAVYCVAFAPDGRLASGAADGTLRLWDPGTGAEIARLAFPEDFAWRLAWSPGGGFLVSGNHGDTVRLWDTRASAALAPPARRAQGPERLRRPRPAEASTSGSRAIGREVEASAGGTPAYGRRGGEYPGRAGHAPPGRTGHSPRPEPFDGAPNPAGPDAPQPFGTGLQTQSRQTAGLVPRPAAPIPAALAPLPRCWCALHRLGIDTPLSLVGELHALLGGRLPPGLEADRFQDWPLAPACCACAHCAGPPPPGRH